MSACSRLSASFQFVSARRPGILQLEKTWWPVIPFLSSVTIVHVLGHTQNFHAFPFHNTRAAFLHPWRFSSWRYSAQFLNLHVIQILTGQGRVIV